MTTAIMATEKLRDLGQSLWLDNITRGLLTSGTLHRYIQEFSITGLTSNPTIFEHAFRNSRLQMRDRPMTGSSLSVQGNTLIRRCWRLKRPTTQKGGHVL